MAGHLRFLLQLGAQVPRYGLVTTANCKQLMLLLEDRHGEAGVDNQDLGLTLLRAAQVNAQPTLSQPCCQSAAHVFACDPCIFKFLFLTRCSLLCMFTASALHYTQQTCRRVLIHKSASAYMVNIFPCWILTPQHPNVLHHSAEHWGLLEYARIQVSPLQTLTGHAQTIPTLRSSENTAFHLLQLCRVCGWQHP